MQYAEYNRMDFLQKPHLPEGGICLCAVSQGQTHIIDSFHRLRIDVIEVPAHASLQMPVAAHSDLLLHDLGAGKVVVAEGCPGLEEMLAAYGYAVTVCRRPLSPQYPGDVALGCFALGGALYCNPSYIAAEVLEAYLASGFRVCKVKQGYTKCSVCIVSEAAIITADLSIKAAAESNGVEALQIEPGHISLPGYNYGFIGGCSGLLDRDLLAFTGEIATHPDAGRMMAFCEKHGVRIHSLASGPLLDIGGILPLAL